MTTLETIIYTLAGYATEGVSGLDLEKHAESLMKIYEVEFKVKRISKGSAFMYINCPFLK